MLYVLIIISAKECYCVFYFIIILLYINLISMAITILVVGANDSSYESENGDTNEGGDGSGSRGYAAHRPARRRDLKRVRRRRR